MKVFQSNIPAEGFTWWLLEHVASKTQWLFTLAILILGVGLIFSFSGYPTGFQRSGCVLVALAITSFYLNHIVSNEIETVKGFNQATRHMKDFQSAMRAFKQSDGEQNLEQQASFAHSVTSTKKRAEKSLPKMRKASGNMVALQFLAGVFGTLVWGFGDIPFLK